MADSPRRSSSSKHLTKKRTAAHRTRRSHVPRERNTTGQGFKAHDRQFSVNPQRLGRRPAPAFGHRGMIENPGGIPGGSAGHRNTHEAYSIRCGWRTLRKMLLPAQIGSKQLLQVRNGGEHRADSFNKIPGGATLYRPGDGCRVPCRNWIKSNMEAFLVSLVVVALAEVGDKTQLFALVLAARFRRPVPVILGIATATLANHTAAAAVGAWVATV